MNKNKKTSEEISLMGTVRSWEEALPFSLVSGFAVFALLAAFWAFVEFFLIHPSVI